MQTDVIRRISIKATQEGVAEATNSLKGLSNAQDGIVGSSEKMTRAQLSVANAYERQQRSLDVAYRSTQQFEKAQRTLDQALQQGIATASRHAELSALNADKHGLSTKAANDNSSAIDLNRAQLLELGHVAKATFEQIAAGAKPLTILTQQGASAAQALSMGGGLGGSLRAVGAGALTLLGPVGLVAAAFLAVEAAVLAAFYLLEKKAPTAEKLLAEQDRLLRVIKDSYDAVTNSASRWFEQGKDVTRLQLLQQEIDLRQKLQGEIGKAIQSTTTASDLGGTSLFSLFGAKGSNVVKEQFEPFEDAIIRLQKGFKDGTPNVREFVDEVARIALLSPALQKLGADLVASVGDASKFDYAIKQIKDSLKLLDGKKLGTDERGRLGLPDAAKTQAQVSAYEQLIQRTKDHIDEMNLEATTTGQVSDAVLRLKLQHDAERAAKKSGVEVNQQVLDQLKDELSLADRRIAQARIDSQIKFADRTKFLSPEDVQIAQQLAGKYGNDIPAALASIEAAELRVIAAQKQLADGFREVGQAVLSAALSGANGMHALTAALDSVAKKLADKAFDNILQGLISGNPLQAGLGVAQAGVSAVISAFTKDQKNAEELKKAQAEWAKAGPAFQAFLKQMSGGVEGELSQRINEAAAREADFEDKAWKARDTAAIQAARAGIVKFEQAEKDRFNATFSASLDALNSGAGLDSPVMKAVGNIKTALNNALSFIDDADVARGASGVALAKQASQAYLLSLLQTAQPLSAVQTGLMQIHGTANALTGALVQLGLSSDNAAKAIGEGVTKAIAALKTQFESGLTERLNTASGQGFLNDATKLIAQHQQDLLDAASLGSDPALVASVFKAEAQKIVDDANLVGDAFKDFTTQFPMLKDVVHEFTQSAVDDSKALRDAQNSAAKSIVDYLNNLTSGPGSNLSPTATLANAQSTYNANLSLAISGNVDAQAKFVSLADNLEKAARAVYASGTGYQDIRSQIISQGLALPSVQSASDPVVAAIRDTIAAINAAASTQALDATLQGVIKSAIDAGNAQQIAALLVPKFDTLNTTADQGLDFNEFVAGLGPSYANVAKNATLAGLLTQDQVSALGLSKDTTTGALFTNTQLQAAGLSKDATVGGLLTKTELDTIGLSTNATVADVRSAISAMDTGNLLKVFQGIAGSDGLISKSELIKQASQSTAVYTSNTEQNTGQLGGNLATVRLLTESANNLANAGNSFLQGINTFTDRIIQALNEIGSVISNVGNTTNTQLAILLHWQPKLVYGGKGELAGTGGDANQSIPYNSHALGGVIPAYGLGLVSEHLNPTFVRAGSEPITVSPYAPVPSSRAGNDNGNAALVAAVRALRAEVAALRTENGVNTMSAARHVGEKVDGAKHAVEKQTDTLAAQQRQSDRQRKVANG